MKKLFLSIALCLSFMGIANVASATSCFCEYYLPITGQCGRTICLPTGWTTASCTTPGQYEVTMQDNLGVCYKFSVQSGPMNVTDVSGYQYMNTMLYVWTGPSATVLVASAVNYGGTHKTFGPSTSGSIGFTMASMAAHSL